MSVNCVRNKIWQLTVIEIPEEQLIRIASILMLAILPGALAFYAAILRIYIKIDDLNHEADLLYKSSGPLSQCHLNFRLLCCGLAIFLLSVVVWIVLYPDQRLLYFESLVLQCVAGCCIADISSRRQFDKIALTVGSFGQHFISAILSVFFAAGLIVIIGVLPIGPSIPFKFVAIAIGGTIVCISITLIYIYQHLFLDTGQEKVSGTDMKCSRG